MEKTEGLVIEIDEHQMVVMCDDGMFRNLPLPERLPRIGERITVDLTARLTARRKPSFWSGAGRWTRMISAAAVLLLVLASATFLHSMGQQQAFGMVNVDINPSVNLYFDEDGVIIKVDALNGDGEKVTETLDLEDKSIMQAITLIWESALNKGYLHDDRENAMMVSVVPLENEQERQAAIQAYAAQIRQELRTGWELQGISGYIEVLAVDIKVKDAAEKTKVSVNKYILQQKAFGRGMVIQNEDLNSSIFEIVDKGNLHQFFERVNGKGKIKKLNNVIPEKNGEPDRDGHNKEEQKPDKHAEEQGSSGNEKSGTGNEDMKRGTPINKDSGKSDRKTDNLHPEQNGKPDKPSGSNKDNPQPEAEIHQQKGTPRPGVPAVDYKNDNDTSDRKTNGDNTDLKEDNKPDNSDRGNRSDRQKIDNDDAASEDNDD